MDLQKSRFNTIAKYNRVFYPDEYLLKFPKL